MPTFPDSELRRRAVDRAVTLAADTSLATQRYERQLMTRYQEGELGMDQVVELLVASTYQILYRSRATRPMSEADLNTLLAHSRRYNAAHGVSGLLLYSDGRFVQVLEGPADAVQALYARIQRDPRHTQVVTVSEGPGPIRRFADWSMGLGHVASPAVVRALDTVLTQESAIDAPVDESLLRALLQSFGVDKE